MDRKNIQAKEKIGSELLLAHHPFQIAVSRGNQTCIGPEGPGASQPLELSLLQDTEKFRLQLKRYLSYLIQKNRAA